jgi:hypothetical protein
MRRISHGIPGHLFALAALFALTLTLLFGGVASASAVPSAHAVSPTVVSCLAASPATQVVIVRETAWVAVAVSCAPIVTSTYIQVKWGDGTIEDYPICQQVCPAILPITVETSHAYLSVGDYHPVFCLVPSPATTSPDCTTVEIKVLEVV